MAAPHSERVHLQQRITKVASCTLQATAADTNPHHDGDSPGFQLYFHAEHLIGDQVLTLPPHSLAHPQARLEKAVPFQVAV